MRSLFITATALAVGGCSPLVPFHFGETAEVLHKKEVSVRASGGGGGGTSFIGGGGGARVRVGVGANQEVGVEGVAIGPGGVYGAKVSWKRAPTSWFAVVGSLDFSYYVGPALGPEVALIFSSPMSRQRPVGIYSGARLGVLFPTRVHVFDDGGITEAIVVPVGLSFEPAARWRIYAEGGFTGALVQNHPDLDPTRPVTNASAVGGYGALTIAVLFGGNR